MDTSNLLTILLFVALFAALVIIHELGHFLAARLFKVEVEEFGIGLPPRILTLFRWKETAFTLNWLPFGGFVRPKGENDPSIPGGLAAARPPVRLAVLLAGPIMNLLAGVLVYSLIFNQIGVPDTRTVMIFGVMPNAPAEHAGLQSGDIILRAGGQDIHDDDALRSLIYSHLDQPLEIVYQRGEQTDRVTAMPLSSRVEEGALGIYLGNPLVPAETWFSTLPASLRETYNSIHQLLTLPVMLIQKAIPAEEARFTGVVGIYSVFEQAVGRDKETQQEKHYTLSLIAIITISLGILNLLPFPALDGGRILFVLPEIIFRRRVSPQLENVVHGIGMAILITLMLYINVMDVINPITITLP